MLFYYYYFIFYSLTLRYRAFDMIDYEVRICRTHVHLGFINSKASRLLDADMLVKKNMDEVMEWPLEEGWIACTHACACNPRKLASYPADW